MPERPSARDFLVSPKVLKGRKGGTVYVVVRRRQAVYWSLRQDRAVRRAKQLAKQAGVNCWVRRGQGWVKGKI